MASKNQHQSRKPQAWQMEAGNIRTERVQFWSGGVMSGQVSRQQAVAEIEAGRAFVICDQAIGRIDANGCMDS